MVFTDTKYLSFILVVIFIIYYICILLYTIYRPLFWALTQLSTFCTKPERYFLALALIFVAVTLLQGKKKSFCVGQLRNKRDEKRLLHGFIILVACVHLLMKNRRTLCFSQWNAVIYAKIRKFMDQVPVSQCLVIEAII